MATLDMSVPHALSEREAKKRIQVFVRDAKKQYGNVVTDVKESWKGNVGTFSGSAKGFALAGTVTILPKEVVLQGEIPWALSFMKGRVEKMIREHAKAILG